MKEIYYKVADHVFALDAGTAESVVFGLRQYEPFVTDPTEDVVFRLRLSPAPLNIDDFAIEKQQEEEGQGIISGHIGEQPCFQFLLQGQLKAVLVCSQDYSKGEIFAENNNLYGINNALIVMYALATADKHTALFHSSTVSHKGKAYMFLGQSGTGTAHRHCPRSAAPRQHHAA